MGSANILPASIEAAKAGATTGEWGDALRAEFGVFRAPTCVSPRARQEAADLDPLPGAQPVVDVDRAAPTVRLAQDGQAPPGAIGRIAAQGVLPLEAGREEHIDVRTGRPRR